MLVNVLKELWADLVYLTIIAVLKYPNVFASVTHFKTADGLTQIYCSIITPDLNLP